MSEHAFRGQGGIGPRRLPAGSFVEKTLRFHFESLGANFCSRQAAMYDQYGFLPIWQCLTLNQLAE